MVLTSTTKTEKQMTTILTSEVIIPGSFVVLQGSPGDGVMNTMDYLPAPLDEDEDNVTSLIQEEIIRQQPPLGSFQTPKTTLGSLSTVIPSTTRDDFVVVTDQEDNEDPTSRNGNINIDSSKRRALVKDWERQDRERVALERQEWREAASTMSPSDHVFMQEEPFWWLTTAGKVAVLRDLPTKLSNGTILTSIMGGLSPGTTLVATDIAYLDSKTLQRIPMKPLSSSNNYDHRLYSKGKVGWMVFVQVEQLGRPGYIAMSCDGYPLLAPGLPSWYIQPDEWIWRVTCPAGAYVRDGLELNTRHLKTLPYGSLVQVTRRTVNNQGLSRLRVSAIVDDFWSPSSQKRLIEGWCSEGLNPLSGNRGSVLLPLPFPVPAMYRISLPIGAVVRSGVELSSPEIGKAERDTAVAITGRAFAEHPVDRCLERLRLASGGWISLRLNRQGGASIVQQLAGEIDWSFDPDHPATYHWQHMVSGDLSSVDSDAVSAQSISSSQKQQIQQCRSTPPQQQLRSQCLICLTEERNATIVHGETGHVVCCLVCSRILKARGDKCPVCRLEIDLVIQHFWA
jgi:E3 ubiquitin-protein ligase Mdm2